MTRPLCKEYSGEYAESHVFYELSRLGYNPKMCEKNQKGYDILLKCITPNVKIEVKHIQWMNGVSNSFILKKAQTLKDAFDYLVLMISDCREGFIEEHNFYVYTKDEVIYMCDSKKSTTGDFTFNLSNCGSKLANKSLSEHHGKWNKILYY